MIEVILPEENANDFSIISNAVLADVCERLCGTSDFVRSYEQRRVGRYFKVVDTESGELHYVVFCNPANDSRNAHLLQFVPIAYRDFYNDPSENKKLHVYLLPPFGNDRTAYIKLFYRCFLTVGIDILNFDQLGIAGLAPYHNYAELREERNANRDRNSHNESTYFEEYKDDERGIDDISIYGKTDGTNINESFILALTIAKIVGDAKPIIFYPVKAEMQEAYRADIGGGGSPV